MTLFKPVNVLDNTQTILGKVLKLTWPTALSMLFHISYSIVDMIWISSLGSNAIAAVTLTGIVMWALFAFSQIFATGVLALVARAHGAGQRDIADKAFNIGIGIGFLSGVMIAAIVAIWPRELLQLLGAAPVVASAGAPYLRIMSMGSPALLALFCLSAGFRGGGDMTSPLVLAGTSAGINAALDPIMIFGYGPMPALGLTGAALASIIPMHCVLIWGLSATRRANSVVRFRLARPNLPIMKDLLTIGIPSGLHYALLSLAQIAMTRMVAVFGTEPVAAGGIGDRITQLSFLPAIGVGAATATMVGQYLGAGRTEDAQKTVRTSLRIAFAITAAISLVYACFPRLLLKVFFITDPVVIELGTIYLRLAAITLLFVSASIILTRVFQGAGDTMWPSVIAAIRLLVFLGLAIILGWSLSLNAEGVWLAMPLSAPVQTLLLAWTYSLGTWKRKTLRALSNPTSPSAKEWETPRID